jgi:trigger factor
MRVSVEALSDLERRVTVQVPAERLTKEIQDRLLSLSRQVKVDGFRPGKAPLKLVKRMYGDRVRYEAVTELMENSLQEALNTEKLSPLGRPSLDTASLEEGQDLQYSATFEIMPEFEPTGFDAIQVERPMAAVTEQDIDEMIQTLRKQHAVWTAVERVAANGDQVRIDFEGSVDGAPFEGGKGENVNVVIGQGAMLKDFEAGLVGLKAGDETTFDVAFPENYQAKELASKTAQFRVKVHTVEESVLPEVNGDFAESFDVKGGGVAGLRQSLRDNMERELKEGVKAAVKRQVMQGLLDANPIALPKVLIGYEIEQLARQLQFPVEREDEKIKEIKNQLFEPEARRRVALGLLISRLAGAQAIKPDEQRILNYLETVASTYQDPSEVIRWYQQTPQALEDVKALVLEDQIVDWLLERAQVTEKASTFAEVMRPAKKPAEAVEQEPSA